MEISTLHRATRERELARRIEAGVLAAAITDGHWSSTATTVELAALVADGELARSCLVLENRGLVHLVVRRLRIGADDRDDAIQDGTVGLLQAIERFDYQRGSFASYALWWITDAMQRGQARRRAVGVKAHRAQATMWRRFEEAVHREGRQVSPRELADRLGVGERVVAQALFPPRVVPLDVEHIEVGDEPVFGADAVEVAVLLARLPQPWRQMVAERFGVERPRRTLAQIAADSGRSVHQVRRLVNEGVQQLRHRLAVDELRAS